MRKVRIQVGEGQWSAELPFSRLKRNDRFRLFETDGTFLCEATAETDAFQNEDHVWTIWCVERNDNPLNMTCPPGESFRNSRHG